jgi:hypothetical protein
MAQSNFTLYRYIKLADGSWRYSKAAFYSNGKIKPNRASSAAKKKNIPRAPTIFITRRVGFLWAQMHWMHSAGGMRSLTIMN